MPNKHKLNTCDLLYFERMNDNFQYLCMINMNLVPTLVDRKWERPAVSFQTFKKGYAYPQASHIS